MQSKIIATIGPVSNSRETLEALAKAGVSIFRLNFSHANDAFFRELVQNIREIEKEIQQPLTIMQDLSGPKIRIGILKEPQLDVQKDDILIIGANANAGDIYPLVPFDNEFILSSLAIGDKLILADGGLEFIVEKALTEEALIEKDALPRYHIRALSHGIITSRKGLNLPGKRINCPAITEKDKEDLKLGKELGVDVVAISFVQDAEDIRYAKQLLKEYDFNVPVVAKIERQSALVNLAEILTVTDIVMLARGDLGVECELSTLPAIQKNVLSACNKASIPVIVATQMLLSMVDSRVPTRAETTDVANAIFDGADCVMLSEETAMGKYPVETVSYMRRIAMNAELYLAQTRAISEPNEESPASDFLAYAVCLLAEKTDACAIVAHSVSGMSARLLSSRKPKIPIYALSQSRYTHHTLNFAWGVLPQLVKDDKDVSHLQRVENFILNNTVFEKDRDIVISAGDYAQGNSKRGTNLVKIFRK